MKQEREQSAFLRFVDKWSFVMVVGICALTIAAAAVWSGSAQKEQTADLSEAAQAAADAARPTPALTLTPKEKAEERSEPTASPAVPTFKSEQAALPEEKEEELPVMAEKTPQSSALPEESAPAQTRPVFTAPLKGKTVRAYAKDELLYSETLRQWMTHPGLDIASAAGTPVVAAADGTVTEVTQDALLGYTVTVDHGEGLTTVYASLSRDGRPAQGAKLRAGDPVGLCDVTAQSETALGAHLHFEVRQDGEDVDPNEFYPDLNEGKE